MFRYVAMIWDPKSNAQSATAEALRRRLEAMPGPWRSRTISAGFVVACADVRPGSSEPHVLHNGLGIVVGTLFERNADPAELHVPRRAVLGETESNRIIATCGQELLTHYWGRYVAFLSDAQSPRRWVLRDPMGGLPCLGTLFRGVRIFFSSITDCMKLDLVDFNIDWDVIHARLGFGCGLADRGALKEIFELYGGECMEITSGHSSKGFYWDPYKIAASNVIDDPAYAEKALHSTVKSCVYGWASCYDNILHRTSGGLDSSVVLSCYADTPSRPAVTGVAYYSPRGNSDERPYARAVAERYGYRLVEQPRNPGAIHFNSLVELPAQPRPVGGAYEFLEIGAFERELTQMFSIDAISNGNSGDLVFGAKSRLDAPVAYVQRYGLSWQLPRLCAQTAARSQFSFHRILLRAIRERFIESDRDLLTKNSLEFRKLLSPGLRAELSGQKACPHPWYRSMSDAPLDTMMLMMWIAMDREFYNSGIPAEAPHPEMLDPLSSQPLAELSLRIPGWIKNCDGLDRELVRRAFANEVPKQILARYWKDRGVGVVEAAFVANRRFIQEVLSDGMLVREGLLDREGVQRAVAGESTKESAAVTEVLDYLFVELWLHSWSGKSRRAVA